MRSDSPTPESRLNPETWLIILAVCGGILASVVFSSFDTPPGSRPQSGTAPADPGALQATTRASVSSANVPLATGDEPIPKLFIQSGCAACHTIPGISAARGREGPRLVLGVNGPTRLADPNYRGTASTVHEYIVESILDPGAYVVPGYPDRVMPRWYGKKLSASALDKIVGYLERVTE